jgi:hypothetical protein
MRRRKRYSDAHDNSRLEQASKGKGKRLHCRYFKGEKRIIIIRVKIFPSLLFSLFFSLCTTPAATISQRRRCRKSNSRAFGR